MITAVHLRVETTGEMHPLVSAVTTVGRGPGVNIALEDPSVSRLHAELHLLGPHLYVSDLGLSTNGTRVNGRPVARRVLREGDVLSFGTVRTRVGGLVPVVEDDDTKAMRRISTPDLTRREGEILGSLCQSALQQEAFLSPATVSDIASALFVTEAAVKQHLLRLYQKFRIEAGTNRRGRLANEVINAGVVCPLPAELPGDHQRGG